uniref:limbic system-associated membrane protein-like isoform X5 n=1 Tax=Myxine glutinosa TaxID=7769 RepID=UPI00358F47A4
METALWRCVFIILLKAVWQGPGDVLSENVTVREGEEAILRCTVLEGPVRRAWLNRSSILFTGEEKWSPEERVSLYKGPKNQYALRLNPAEPQDEGSYSCSQQPPGGVAAKIAIFHLSVQVPPQIYNMTGDITTDEMSNVSLHCRATGNPEPQVTWKRILPPGHEWRRSEVNLPSVMRKDAGTYECSARNGVTTPARRQMILTIRYPPVVTEVHGAGAALGETAVLRCEASAQPPPEFSWFRDEHRVVARHGIRLQTTDSRSLLMFPNVTNDHYGNYTCIASNPLGTSAASNLLHQDSSHRRETPTESSNGVKEDSSHRRGPGLDPRGRACSTHSFSFVAMLFVMMIAVMGLHAD